MAIGRSKSQTNRFFPGNRHIAVSQAVDTPISKVPAPTPKVSSSELPRYSGKTVSLRCCQFSPGGSKTEKTMVRIGTLSIKAVPTILGRHMRLVIFFIAYSIRLKAPTNKPKPLAGRFKWGRRGRYKDIYYIPGGKAPQCERNIVKVVMLSLTKNGFSRQGINVE